MDNVSADFVINNNNNLNAEYTINNSENFDCSFELFASGTVWGNIDGDIENQTDLQNVLNTKQDILTAGSNIQIVNNVISATDTTYTAGTGISIQNGVISNTNISAVWGNIAGTLSNQTDLQDALNSKQDTISDLSTIRQNADNGNSAYGTIQTYGDIVTYNAASFATSAQGALADTAVQPADLSTVATTGDYDDLLNKPTIPAAANDGTLTIQVNGSDLATFTANQSTDTTANIVVPDSATWGNITGTLSDQTDLQNALDAKVTNNATGTKALAVGNTSQSTAEGGVAVGYGARANSTYATAVGKEARANNTNTTVIGKAAKATEARAIAIGSGAEANAQDAIAIKGINNTANTFQVYTYNLLDMSTGLIPDARISSNIARTTDIPSLTNYVTTNTAQTISSSKAFSQPLIIADNNGLASGTILSNKKILQRSSGDNTLTLNNIDNKLRLVGSETRPKYSTDGTNFGELALYSDVTAIDDLIPAQASISNQLADKAFVNSTIQTNTANFRGNWADWTDVPTIATDYPADASGNKKPTVNDYMVVQDASDYTLDTLTGTWRFKYTGDWDIDGKSGWQPEYQVNETPLTQAQLDAINSGITSGDVTLIGTALQPNDNVSSLNNDAGYITSASLPTVNDATLTIQKNSTNVGTFTANASSNVTIDLSIPTDTNDLTNGAGYITASSLPTIDQTYDGTSANAQSGAAIAGELSNYQAKLVSGTNIKTINNTTILGSGNFNLVDLGSNQNITGEKTFVGAKRIKFKQSGIDFSLKQLKRRRRY